MHLGFVQYFKQNFNDFDLVYKFKTYKTLFALGNLKMNTSSILKFFIQIIHVIYNITTSNSSNL
jgi:hypothetical protein